MRMASRCWERTASNSALFVIRILSPVRSLPASLFACGSAIIAQTILSCFAATSEQVGGYCAAQRAKDSCGAKPPHNPALNEAGAFRSLTVMGFPVGGRGEPCARRSAEAGGSRCIRPVPTVKQPSVCRLAYAENRGDVRWRGQPRSCTSRAGSPTQAPAMGAIPRRRQRSRLTLRQPPAREARAAGAARAPVASRGHS